MDQVNLSISHYTLYNGVRGETRRKYEYTFPIMLDLHVNWESNFIQFYYQKSRIQAGVSLPTTIARPLPASAPMGLRLRFQRTGIREDYKWGRSVFTEHVLLFTRLSEASSTCAAIITCILSITGAWKIPVPKLCWIILFIVSHVLERIKGHAHYATQK